jgi:DNA helicase II / ATP-dependent DNA helicase PcrA
MNEPTLKPSNPDDSGSSLLLLQRLNKNVTPEHCAIINQECQTLATVLESLEKQSVHVKARLNIENSRARDLTSELVETRRLEDKQQLASDEAVVHALKDRQKDELDRLERQCHRPYFAHFEVTEERSGKKHVFQYKIGFETNLDCRIIDWRDAPLSRLYYHYDENEEYCEDIQGKERFGTITKKVRLNIYNRALHGISTKSVELHQTTSGTWATGGDDPQRSFFHLPDVLSLITPEQFALITEEADSAVLIQGVAGSGKSTVGLYRLAWLVRNNKAVADTTAIVVRNPALKEYIVRSLPSVQLDAIKVYTYFEWVTLRLCGEINAPEINKERPHPKIIIQKESMEFATLVLEETQKNTSEVPRAFDQLVQWYNRLALTSLEAAIGRDRANERKYQECLIRTRKNIEQVKIDYLDLPILLLVIQQRGLQGYLPNRTKGHYSHLVIDEVQDLNQILLTTIIQSVKETSRLTLLGDEAQELKTGFPGWTTLISWLKLPVERSRFLQLDVSFRCSLPIIRFAEHLQSGRSRTTKGRAGRTPIWFHSTNGESALKIAQYWINRAMRKYPLSLTAILCKSHQEARYLYQLLKPYFKNTIHVGTHEGFSSSDGVVVTSIAASKGMEFQNVVVWNTSYNNYRANSTRDRNLLYVATTRARENLCLISWNTASDTLPRNQGRLVRFIDETIVEDS